MGRLQNTVKNILPRSLLGRSIMIIVTPLVILQVVSGFIFYESHWDKVTLRLARGVAGDVASVITMMRQFPGDENKDRIVGIAAANLGLSIRMAPGEILPNEAPQGADLMERMLIRSLSEQVNRPFQIDARSLEKYVVIRVQLPDGIVEFITSRKRLFSSTVYVFVLWMVGTSLILFGVATIFMRNQVKPIRRLAIAADNFGKGREVTGFKPEGAMEVRQAASAFLAMRERILRQIGQRTDMLAGVSHDLRTPLTRMKLQLEMARGLDGVDDMKADVDEMEHMLESYLAFARGEGAEPPRPTNLTDLLNEVAAQARRGGGAVDLHTEGEIALPLRPNTFKRALTNLIENAQHYADHVSVNAGRRGDVIEVVIDDDGPGIPEDKRDDVFKPFYRLDAARKPGTGGTGLGLAIARDVVRGHGGDIELDDAPGGGLRARIRLPL
ncbi:MAG: two-component sensor histidine kinase [Rhodospirillales bacterium]|nr:two-component sensor histidine kinase [Alphaproteobacteria bacterium]MBL6929090.1 two-component sensor histidine kinase [Rhodospirillales bacterium]